MKVTLKELKRIADICMLDFTKEEYDMLKEHIEKTLTDIETVYCDGSKASLSEYEKLYENFCFAQNSVDSTLLS